MGEGRKRYQAVGAKKLNMGYKSQLVDFFSDFIIFSILGYIFAPEAAVLLGATDELLPYSIQYARINMAGMTAFMLQPLFQSFLITAERPRMGFWITVAAGITNMILDYYLVAVLRMGLSGAAWATVISQLVGGIIPLIYFLIPNKTVLRLGRTKWDGNAILRTCSNGLSELLSNAASSIDSYDCEIQEVL